MTAGKTEPARKEPMDGNATPPTTDPQSLLEAASSMAESWEKSAKTFEASVAARRAEIERGFSGIPDPVTRAKLTKEHADKAEVDLRRAEVLLSKNFHQRRRALAELEKNVDDLAALRSSDVGEVDSATLASAKRATYTQNLAGSGGAGILRHARRAIATRDAELGAACMLVLQGMPVRDRPITLKEIASACVPSSVTEAREKLATAKKALSRAIKAFWKFQAPTPVERISFGLRYGPPRDGEDA